MLRSIKKLTLVSNPARRGMGRCIQSNVVAGRYFIRDRSTQRRFQRQRSKTFAPQQTFKEQKRHAFFHVRSKGAADSGASEIRFLRQHFTVCLTSCVGFVSAAYGVHTCGWGQNN